VTGDARRWKALSHPLRQEILRHLGEHDAANATTIVEDQRARRLQPGEDGVEPPVVAGLGRVHDSGHRDGPAGLRMPETDDRGVQHAAPYAQDPEAYVLGVISFVS
jgi:hypothetical protein